MERKIKGLDLSQLTAKYGVEPTIMNAYKLMKEENEENSATSEDIWQFLKEAYNQDEETNAVEQHGFFISTYSDDLNYAFGLKEDGQYFEEEIYDNNTLGDVFIGEYYNYAITHGYTPESFVLEFINFRHEKEQKALTNFKELKNKQSSKRI